MMSYGNIRTRSSFGPTSDLQFSYTQITMDGLDVLERLKANDPTLGQSLDVVVPDDIAAEFAQALQTNKHITEFYFYSSILGCRAFFRAWQRNDTISILSLSSNNLDPPAIIAFAAVLAKDTTIKQLNLYNNNVGDAAIELADALETNSTLQELILINTQITARGMRALSDVLQRNCTSITSLYLGDNHLRFYGGKQLGLVLKTNITLIHLSLQRTALHWGGTDIALALAFNSTLKELDLTDCELNFMVGIALAQALERNTTLTSLKLTDNNFYGNDVGVAFGKALHINTSLCMLGLRNTCIDTTGIEAIGAALKVNRTLMQLDIAMNIYDDIATFLEGLNQNYILQELGVDEEQLDDEFKRLQILLDRNKKNAFWTRQDHQLCLPRCHTTIVTALMAANRFSVKLPAELWADHIFTFFRQTEF